MWPRSASQIKSGIHIDPVARDSERTRLGRNLLSTVGSEMTAAGARWASTYAAELPNRMAQATARTACRIASTPKLWREATIGEIAAFVATVLALRPRSGGPRGGRAGGPSWRRARHCA